MPPIRTKYKPLKSSGRIAEKDLNRLLRVLALNGIGNCDIAFDEFIENVEDNVEMLRFMAATGLKKHTAPTLQNIARCLKGLRRALRQFKTAREEWMDAVVAYSSYRRLPSDPYDTKEKYRYEKAGLKEKMQVLEDALEDHEEALRDCCKSFDYVFHKD
ncbi:hypothetical protein BJ508DRAFT_331030 [Ascobolus immersus RN42]|uniref:Uncharacterized protein n=1 Tax=Ascobolus immersus RN42 TaxID=1160509 RepID=A0A3N4HWY9_ASCIM|nr:hypothetical protein BJ508DRAFT_331030 [Ascobolus immersus RN42]